MTDSNENTETETDVELLEELAEAPGTNEVMDAYGEQSGYSYGELKTSFSFPKEETRDSILGKDSE